MRLAADFSVSKIVQELQATRANLKTLRSEVQERPDDLELEETVAELNAELAHLERLAAHANHVRAKHARACAAIAQTDTEYFCVMCKLLDPLVKIFPQHPMVRQWIEVRKTWQHQLLKKN